MVNTLLLPEIRSMLAEGDEAGISALLELHPATVADFAEGLSLDETWQLLQRGDIHTRTEVFTFFPHDKQLELMDGVGRQHIGRVIEAMPHDERVQLLRQLDPEVMETLLPLVSKADNEDIRRLLAYPEDSAGSVMTTDYAWLEPDIPVNEAIFRLRQQAATSETIYYIYVLEADRRLLGFVSLHDLILARPNVMLRTIMTEDPISVRVDQSQADVANMMGKYDFLAVPVVDDQGHLVGIVTHDDVLDVVVEQQTEDVQRMASVVPIEENYLEAPFLTVWRKRTAWLALLFVAELFTFSALASYQDAIQQVVALSLFVPLCLSTGGNSGSQAATLIARSMMLGHITPNKWFQVIRHELIVGLMLGVTLGSIGFLRVWFTPATVLHGADHWKIALVIGQAVAAICLWGTMVGSMLPILFKRLGVDPGYASSPFVATFVDVTGIVIYFSIAKIYLLS